MPAPLRSSLHVLGGVVARSACAAITRLDALVLFRSPLRKRHKVKRAATVRHAADEARGFSVDWCASAHNHRCGPMKLRFATGA